MEGFEPDHVLGHQAGYEAPEILHTAGRASSYTRPGFKQKLYFAKLLNFKLISGTVIFEYMVRGGGLLGEARVKMRMYSLLV